MTHDYFLPIGVLLLCIVCVTSCSEKISQDPYQAFEEGHYAVALPALETLSAVNDAKAQTYLAAMYQAGYGVKRDYKKATEWYEKAAYQNYAPAQYNLGIMLREGTGGTQDLVQAYAWLYNADRLGHPNAYSQLEPLVIEIMPDKSLQAREWVREQIKQGHKDLPKTESQGFNN